MLARTEQPQDRDQEHLAVLVDEMKLSSQESLEPVVIAMSVGCLVERQGKERRGAIDDGREQALLPMEDCADVLDSHARSLGDIVEGHRREPTHEDKPCGDVDQSFTPRIRCSGHSEF